MEAHLRGVYVPNGVGDDDLRGQEGQLGTEALLLILEETSLGGQFAVLRGNIVVIPTDQGVEDIIAATCHERNIDRTIGHHTLQGDKCSEAVLLLMCEQTDRTEVVGTIDDMREVGMQVKMFLATVDAALDVCWLHELQLDVGELLKRRTVP